MTLTSLQPHPIALVGAGPGDPELLTLRALRHLKAADVVFYDRLVSEAVLALIPDSVNRIDVGKRLKSPRGTQQLIHRLMIAYASLGHRVVRLKGGDPFIFGRGTEEIDACQAAGFQCEVVPGISSALAAPAAAGVPLTERGLARSFAVVTAETRTQDDISQLRSAAAADTVVLLMTAKKLTEVTHELQRLGRSANEPAAAIERATQPGQRVVAATLSTLAEQVEAEGLKAPMTVVLGAVAARAQTSRSEGFGSQSRPPLQPAFAALPVLETDPSPWITPVSPPSGHDAPPEILR